MTEHNLLDVKIYSEDDPRFQNAHGECSCGWMVGCRTKTAVETAFRKHVTEQDAQRFIVTIDGKEHVVRPEQVRPVKGTTT